MVTEFNLQYYDVSGSYYSRRTVRVPRTEAMSQSYTAVGLVASTTYSFQVQAVTSDRRTSSYSSSQTITTLPPGILSTIFLVMTHALILFSHFYNTQITL